MECRNDQNSKEHDGPCLSAALLSLYINFTTWFFTGIVGGGGEGRSLRLHP